MKKLTRRQILKYIGAGAAMTAVPLSGCMGEEKIQIGAILPQSGNLDDYGPPMLRGVELAAKRVNEKNGGVLGKEVEIASQDSQTESQAANSALQTLINVDGVPAFIGAAGSGVSKTILDTAIDNEVVQISPSNTSPDFTDMEDEGYYWRTCSSDEYQAAAMAKYSREQGNETASILYINNSYGQGFANQFEEWFQDELGGEVLNKVSYSRDASSYSSEISSAGEGDPDLVILIGYPQDGAIVLSDAYQTGLLDEANWLLSEGLRSDGLAEQVGTTEDEDYIVEGMIGTTPDSRAAEDAYNAFLEHYQDEYGEEPGTFVPQSYDACSLILMAIEKAGEATGPAIRDNMMEVANSPGTEVYDPVEAIELIRDGEDVDYVGAGGMQDFNEVGDVVSDFALWSINEEGVVELGQKISLPEELQP